MLGAAGKNPRRFGGRDLIARLGGYRRGDGSFAGQLVYSSFGVLALRAAGRGKGDGAVRSAAKWIARRQNGDGGFNTYGKGGGSELDATAAAVQALVAAGRRGKPLKRAVAFMRGRQNRDGGFPLSPGATSNAQSTAFVAQALTAAGVNRTRCAAAGAGRSATCARSRPPTAPCATRAARRRRRCG